jgi:hypothetical protein
VGADSNVVAGIGDGHERTVGHEIILSLHQNTGKYRIPCNERIIEARGILSWMSTQRISVALTQAAPGRHAPEKP